AILHCAAETAYREDHRHLARAIELVDRLVEDAEELFEEWDEAVCRPRAIEANRMAKKAREAAEEAERAANPLIYSPGQIAGFRKLIRDSNRASRKLAEQRQGGKR